MDTSIINNSPKSLKACIHTNKAKIIHPVNAEKKSNIFLIANQLFYSFSEHVLAGSFDDSCGFTDELVSDSKLLEGGTEILDDGIEMDVLEVHAFVSVNHVLALICVGTAQKHGEETSLLADLMCHIGVLEEVLDSGINENFLVEERDSSIHGSLASESDEN